MLTTMLVIAALAAPAAARDGGAEAADDARAIEAVIDEFLAGVADQDKARILSGFVDGEAVFATVIPGEDADATDRFTAERFADLVASQTRAPRETFRNLDIRVYETTAVATFDYTFLLDDRPINSGREVWSLIKAPEGWKAVSVIWSTNFHAPED